MKVSLLAVGVARENKKRSDRHRHHLANVGCTLGAANPPLVLLKKFPYRGMMSGFVRLEVQVECYQRPISVVALLQSMLHQRTYTLKKIVLHGRLVTVDRFSVGDE